jgi:hypothetical protein
MSQYEKFAWGSLFASLLAWLFLTMRMTDMTQAELAERVSAIRGRVQLRGVNFSRPRYRKA